MQWGWRRAWLLPVALYCGCDALTVRAFGGSVLQLTLEQIGPTATGQHLELWAVLADDLVVRLAAYSDPARQRATFGLAIRPAIAPDSPCMINESGYLLTDSRAYTDTVSGEGVPQSPEQQAAQVRQRIAQLRDAAGAPPLAVLPFDSTPDPVLSSDAAPEVRRAACASFESSPLSYVPNPLQLTAPLHGAIYGFVGFTAAVPPVSYDGIRLDLPRSLAGLRGLIVTRESEDDPLGPGPAYLQSRAIPGGREVLHFALEAAAPNDSAHGAATLLFGLDRDPVQF